MNRGAVVEALERMRSTRLDVMDMAALHSRNPTAHRYKAMYRAMHIKVLVHWRLSALLDEALQLHEAGRLLGASLLIRAALETLALLIDLNNRMGKVVKGDYPFTDFTIHTERWLLGSRVEGAEFSSVSVLTTLDHCDRLYEGLRSMYDHLSETAHPNYAGMMGAFCRIDHDADVVRFESQLAERDGEMLVRFASAMSAIHTVENDHVFPMRYEWLEHWVAARHDAGGALPENL